VLAVGVEEEPKEAVSGGAGFHSISDASKRLSADKLSCLLKGHDLQTITNQNCGDD